MPNAFRRVLLAAAAVAPMMTGYAYADGLISVNVVDPANPYRFTEGEVAKATAAGGKNFIETVIGRPSLRHGSEHVEVLENFITNTLVYRINYSVKAFIPSAKYLKLYGDCASQCIYLNVIPVGQRLHHVWFNQGSVGR